ncbi:MAG TPA: polyhydroxyalkanoate synthesis repressor PhaR, partial [Acidiphilium sp.]
QARMRATMQQTMGSFLPPGMEEIGRQNMAMMERAMSLFAPFAGRGDAPQSAPQADETVEEIDTLRREVERLQAELAALRARGGKRA